jgi:hypothetical protein
MPYFEHVLESDEASRRATVKLLTRTIEEGLVELTINAPDWSVTHEVYVSPLSIHTIQGHSLRSTHGTRPTLGRPGVS